MPVISFPQKDTGLRCCHEPLFVGDILSIYSGMMGFAIVSEDEKGFLLEEYDIRQHQPTGKIERRLDRDIAEPYGKVDPDNPFAIPKCGIICSQCLETVIGYEDMEDDSVEWTENCGEHHSDPYIRTVWLGDQETETIPDIRNYGKCKACTADPNRTSKTRQLCDYAVQRYKEEGLDLGSVHIPGFRDRDDVEEWITGLKELQSQIEQMTEEGE